MRTFIKFGFISLAIASVPFGFSLEVRADDFPEFREGSVWQSIVVTKMGDLSTTGVSKKWIVVRADGKRILRERTQLSLEQDASGHPTWTSLSLPLDGTPIECASFTNMPFPISSSLRRLPGGRFALSYDMGFKFEVLIIPSVAKSEAKIQPRQIGVMAAPLDDALRGPNPSIGYSNGFLHHTSEKMVIVDPSVPPRFLSSIQRVVHKWNRGLGRRIYRNPVIRAVSAEECLGGRLLCIRWQGTTEPFSWIGWGGVAALSFDPEDGELIGGLVTIQNLRAPGMLVRTPQEVIDTYSSGKVTPAYFAAMMLRKEEFKGYEHPFENDLFESQLMHEIGHANGFKHDFSASTEGEIGRYSGSIMDYLPFPNALLMTDLGRRDLARLEDVYKGVTYSDYDGCSDEMESSGLEVNCAKGDWGPPQRWYVDIVRDSPKGVFETVTEYLSGLPARDYLSIFAKFFSGILTSSTQRNKIQDFLCQQESRDLILRDLKQEHQVDIGCP